MHQRRPAMRGTISLRTFETLSGQCQAPNLAAERQHAELLKLSSGKPLRANSDLAVKAPTPFGF